MLPLVLSSDSHVFEPPDLWQTRIDRAFRDRAPRIERIDGGDHVVVEADQILSGIGLISNAGARFEAPETISAQGRFEDVHRGGYDPEQHLKDMALDGVAGEVLYPIARALLLQGGGHAADVGHLSRVQRLARRVLPHRSRPPQGHRDDQPRRRRGRDQGAGARRPPRPLRCDDHRVSSRGPALRPTRVRAVLGRRRRTRYAIEPAHGDATAGQDPRRRSRNAARRQQPRDQGVLSGIVDVRHDLLRRLRASSPPDPGHRRVRAVLGAECAHLYGLHLPRAPRRGALPVQGRHAARATSSAATSS